MIFICTYVSKEHSYLWLIAISNIIEQWVRDNWVLSNLFSFSISVLYDCWDLYRHGNILTYSIAVIVRLYIKLEIQSVYLQHYQTFLSKPASPSHPFEKEPTFQPKFWVIHTRRYFLNDWHYCKSKHCSFQAILGYRVSSWSTKDVSLFLDETGLPATQHLV